MSVTVKYETIDNSVGSGRDYGRGARNLGKSDQANLTRAFVSPINSNQYTAANAAAAFESYGGVGNENVSYGLGMYRRNFTPDPAAGEIYSDPRDKDATPTGAAGLPATPYSPNVASPGEGNGVTATSISQEVVGLVPVNARPQEIKKKVNVDELVPCGICGEEVLESRMRSHINAKHHIINAFCNMSKYRNNT